MYMAKKWLIGCSGFAYKEWKDLFYPAGIPQSKWFHYYTQHFNTLELNVTFYRFPTLKSLSGWYEKSPEGFIFSAKVPRSITHYRKFEDTERMLNDFYSLLKEGLKEKMGCVLFQLPGSFRYSDEKLQKMIAQIDHSFTNVIEFRNEEWWRKDVTGTLKKNNILFCGVSYPKLPDDAVVNTSVSYYRFHGVPKLFFSEYSKAFVKKIYSQLAEKRTNKTVYVYFNNTATQAAINNARYLQSLIKE
jgi:uncharacterized protein YecE (DUF72 family)